MSRKLRREIKVLRNKHKRLRAEEYEISDSPDGIAHFEDYYVRSGRTLPEIRAICARAAI